MAHTARSKQSGSSKPSRIKPPAPDRPLRQERQEVFAIVFAETLSPEQAAISAGYVSVSAARVARRLLAISAMQDRIRYLQQRDAESLNGVKLVHSLYLHPKELIAKAASRNPFTGEVTLDLARLTPRELSVFDFKLCADKGNLGAGAAISLQSNAAGTLTALERIINNPNYAPERKEKTTLTDALREIAQRNDSAAPIREVFWND